MSVLAPPVPAYSLEGLLDAAADASGTGWTTVLPAGDGWFVSLKFTNADQRLGYRTMTAKVPITNFGMDNRELMRFYAGANGSDSSTLLAVYSGASWSFKIKSFQGRNLWLQYKAIGFLLFTFDGFVSQIQAGIDTGEGFNYREWEEVSRELRAENEKMVAAYSALTSTLKTYLVDAPPSGLVLVPPSWAQAFQNIQAAYANVMGGLTGLVENFDLEKARADQADAEAELARQLVLIQEQQAAASAKAAADRAALQLQGLNYVESLPPGARYEEEDQRRDYLDRLKNENYNWSYNQAVDNIGWYDVAKAEGIPLADVDAAFATPESREAMMGRLDSAAQRIAAAIQAGTAPDWVSTPTGYKYEGETVDDSDAAGVLEAVGDALPKGWGKPVAILAGAGIGLAVIRKLLK